MRWVCLVIIVVFVTAVVLFTIQNLAMVTMAFLGFSVRAPLAILTAIVYILGAASGASVLALLRKSIHGSRAR
jgi:lipopolysaccharide assembly protein A